MVGLATALKKPKPLVPPAPAVVAPKPVVPAAPRVPAPTDISQILSGITDPNSAVMRQAATEGAKVAQRRGLLSSSIAAGTAQNEVLKVAAPLAQTQLQANVTSNEGEAQRQAEATQAQFERDLKARMQLSDQRATAIQAAAERATKVQLSRESIAADKAQYEANIKAQERLQSMQLDAADRQNVSAMVANYQSVYENQIEAINANKLLSATARAQQVKDLQTRRTAFLNFASDIYDVDISWTTTPAAAPASAKPTAAKPATKPAKPAPIMQQARGYADSTGWHAY